MAMISVCQKSIGIYQDCRNKGFTFTIKEVWDRVCSPGNQVFEGQTIILIIGGVLPFLGLADISKKYAFQTIFFITFCNENNFFATVLKNVWDFLWILFPVEINTFCALIHMESLI